MMRWRPTTLIIKVDMALRTCLKRKLRKVAGGGLQLARPLSSPFSSDYLADDDNEHCFRADANWLLSGIQGSKLTVASSKCAT